MLPKEKAKELIDKYSKIFSLTSIGLDVDFVAKRCAQITADEILESVSDFAYSGTVWNKQYDDGGYRTGTYEDASSYWQQVKQELESHDNYTNQEVRRNLTEFTNLFLKQNCHYSFNEQEAVEKAQNVIQEVNEEFEEYNIKFPEHGK